MELIFNKLHFSLFLFLFLLLTSFIFQSWAKPNLDLSNYNAFKIIQTDFGINDHHPTFTTIPCNSPAISCNHRISNYTNVVEITNIVYDYKQLGGSISPEIGQLSELRELTLTNNHLTGQLPQEITACKKLEVLNLRNNHFIGNVPSELSKLVELRFLDLSVNRFSGDLRFLKYLTKLETLSLSDNLFTGKIPSSLRLFRNLQLFNISGNDKIQDIVPKRYMLAQNSTRNSQSSSRGGVEGPAQAPSTSIVFDNEMRSNKKLVSWLLGLLIGSGFGFFSGLAISVSVKVCLGLARGREIKYGISIFSPLIKKAEDLAFLEKEDGLSGLQVIGHGGCGEVYKAECPGLDGKLIAIKKIIPSEEEAEDLNEENSKVLSSKLRQVRAEIQTIGKIRHCNVLPLLAHVARPDCHLLVYEFVKNGSLQDKMAKISEENSELGWLTRYRIALGIATGLEYLHINNSPKIIHRDLKPGNILLDDEMEPRIADFGLAKEMPIGKTHLSTVKVAGTLGYIAPEFHQTLKFTDKCDVFSFGIILGSLVIGKVPSDQFFQDTKEMHIVTWMRNVLVSEDPTIAIDPTLRGNGYEEQMLQVLRIACFCTVEDPKQRPNSKDVRCMLSQIIH